MIVEFISEVVFDQEVQESGEVWVMERRDETVYALEFTGRGEGFSLPVWSTRERALVFLKNAEMAGAGYEPHAVGLGIFVSRWLTDRMHISELLINMDGTASQALIQTPEEFRHCHYLKQAV